MDQATIDALTKAFADALKASGVVAAPPTPAAPAVPTISGHALRIDPIVPPGTPGTTTLPVTGHVLSNGRPPGGEGETFGPYCVRVSLQCGADPNWAANAQLAMMQQGSDFGATDDPKTWPLAADQFYCKQLLGYNNPYISAADRAKQSAAQAAWAADYQNMITHAAANPDATKAQAKHVARNRNKGVPAPAPTPAPGPTDVTITPAP